LVRGDVLRVVGDERSIRNVAKVLGNDARATTTASLLAIALGAVAGFALGALPLTLPGVGSFSLGTTGGVLVAGLVLGARHKTGPLIWEVPTAINSFMRDAGLLLFLAVVGTRAGGSIVATLADQGLPLLVAGVAVTLAPIAVSLWVCRRLLGVDFLRMLGVIAGGMTSTPGLATATALSSTPHAASAYATVYPVALVGMIVAVKLVTILSGLWT
jgi:putative transport protein